MDKPNKNEYMFYLIWLSEIDGMKSWLHKTMGQVGRAFGHELTESPKGRIWKDSLLTVDSLSSFIMSKNLKKLVD